MRKQFLIILFASTFLFFSYSWVISQNSGEKTKEINEIEEITRFVLPVSQVIFEFNGEFLKKWEQKKSSLQHPKALLFEAKAKKLGFKPVFLLRDFGDWKLMDVVTKLKKDYSDKDLNLIHHIKFSQHNRQIDEIVYQDDEQKWLMFSLFNVGDSAIAVEFHIESGLYDESQKDVFEIVKSSEIAENKLKDREVIALRSNVTIALPKGFAYVIPHLDGVLEASINDLMLLTLV